MSTSAQHPQPLTPTFNGEDPDDNLSMATTIIAAGCKVLADLVGKDPGLDAHFENRKRILAKESALKTAIVWLKIYCKSMHDMNRQIKFIPDGPLNFLDLGCAPGGYSKCVLETNPTAIGTGVCLPVHEGGHLFKLPKYMRARYTVHYADMTKYTLRKGEKNGYPCPPPFQPASFDLVVADGHPIHTREYNAQIAHILVVTQLIIAINAVKEGGTIFIKFSKLASFNTACALYLLDSICSSLETIKPLTVHGNRGTFYAIARGVQRGEVLKEYLNVLRQMRQDLLENIALDPGSIPRVYERITTLEQLKTCYIPRLIELGTPVWEVQKEHLDWFIRNKGSGGSPKVELQGETDIQDRD
ncbi:hypothetical protein FRC01_003287 [Tulasnella sp. 417]|nr:hypothetical protein FRC01_003287 [Tulasnella sp. 417]